MRILGIESSSLVASVAIVTDDILMAEYTVNFKKTHSQTLLPMIDEIVRMLEIPLDTIDAIAVSAGPGSFTGLRIGSATAKGLGLALNKPLIHVPTVDAMAYGLFAAGSLICPLMDARRSQVYTGLYRYFPPNAGEGDFPYSEDFTIIKPQCVVIIDEMIEEINQRKEPVIFLGDGVPVCKEKIESSITVPYSFAPSYCNRQRAGVVAALGAVYYVEGKTETAAEHGPDYLRLSQAERERMEKESENNEHS